MEALTKLYCFLQDENIILDSHDITSHKAVSLHMESDYAIFVDYKKIKTLEEEFLVMAHEYGHCSSGALHKLSSPLDLIEKHEYKAQRQAIHKCLPVNDFKKAINNGCVEFWEIAEYLDLPEEFVKQAYYIYNCEGIL